MGIGLGRMLRMCLRQGALVAVMVLHVIILLAAAACPACGGAPYCASAPAPFSMIQTRQAEAAGWWV